VQNQAIIQLDDYAAENAVNINAVESWYSENVHYDHNIHEWHPDAGGTPFGVVLWCFVLSNGVSM
jgi:hypothetical protein